MAARVVLEVSHITYGGNDEPFEVVVSARSSADSAVMFETDETSAATRPDEAGAQ